MVLKGEVEVDWEEGEGHVPRLSAADVVHRLLVHEGGLRAAVPEELIDHAQALRAVRGEVCRQRVVAVSEDARRKGRELLLEGRGEAERRKPRA